MNAVTWISFQDELEKIAALRCATTGAPKVKGLAQLLKEINLRYPVAPKPPSPGAKPKGDVIS